MANGNGSGGPTEEERERIKDKILEKWDETKEARKPKPEEGSDGGQS